MKIKPATLFLVLTALLLAGVVALVVTQPPSSQQAAEAGQQQLFSFKEKQIQSFTLKTQLRSLKFERDKAGKWQMLEPDKTAASDPSIAYLLDLLATGKSDRTFTAPTADQKDYSFHQPLATIEVKLDNQQAHKLILGGYDFNHSFIYAQVDPPAKADNQMKVLLVSPNFESAVSRPLAEWKQSSPTKEPGTSKNPAPASTSESAPAKASPESKAQASPESQSSESQSSEEKPPASP